MQNINTENFINIRLLLTLVTKIYKMYCVDHISCFCDQGRHYTV